MGIKLNQTQTIAIFSILAVTIFASAFYFGVITPPTGSVFTGEAAGNILSFSPTSVNDAKLIRASVVLNPGGEIIKGQTAATGSGLFEDLFGYETTVPFEVKFYLQDAGCSWNLIKKTDTNLIYQKEGTDLAVTLTPHSSGMSLACSMASYPSRTFYNSGECSQFSLYSVTVASACEPDYRRVCGAQGGTVLKTTASSAQCLRCARIEDDTSRTSTMVGDIYTTSTVSYDFAGQIKAYKSGTLVQTIDIADTYAPTEAGISVSKNPAGVIKYVSVTGGLIAYGRPQCPSGLYTIKTSGTSGRWLDDGAVYSAIPTRKTKEQYAEYDYNLCKTEISVRNGKITDYLGSSAGTFNTDFPVRIDTSSSQTRLKYSASLGRALTFPVIVMDIDGNELGITRPVSNVAISNCNSIKSNMASLTSGQTKTVTYQYSNSGAQGARYTIEFSGCSGISFSPRMIDATTSTSSTGGSGTFTVSGLSTSEISGVCNLIVRDGEGDETNRCSVPYTVSLACDMYANAPETAFDLGSKWNWTEATCIWTCPPTASCPIGQTFQGEPICKCVAESGGGGIGECSVPANARITNPTTCAWVCKEGYLQKLIGGVYYCERITEDDDDGDITLSCYEMVDAKVCEPWDIMCPVGKQIDKIGCTVQDIVSNVVLLIIALGTIAVLGLVAVVLMKKKVIRVKRR